jgi:hypothetical protein
MIIDEFNRIIKSFGIKHIYLRKYDIRMDKDNPWINEGGFILVYYKDQQEKMMYSWRDENEFLVGINNRYNIFDISKDFLVVISWNEIELDSKDCEFFKIVSESCSLDEIRLKMQLCGYKI